MGDDPTHTLCGPFAGVPVRRNMTTRAFIGSNLATQHVIAIDSVAAALVQ